MLGEPLSGWDPSVYSQTDDTSNAAFIPTLTNFIQASGTIVEWHTYFDIPAEDFYFQVR